MKRSFFAWAIRGSLLVLGLTIVSSSDFGQTAPQGALFHFADSQLPSPLVLVGFGDMRCTDPAEKEATNPEVRRALFDKIASEKPFALMLGGDVPWHGSEWKDYEVFQSETAAWRAANIFVSPATGNHELIKSGELGSAILTIQMGGGVATSVLPCDECLGNWWRAFPQVKGYRWYSVEVGSKVLILNLDSNFPLKNGADLSVQGAWLRGQLAHLPGSVKFVFFNLHHPPISAVKPSPIDPDMKPLLDLIKEATSARHQARFVVIGGHVHNYERFLNDDTIYLVSGGGGAKPFPLDSKTRKAVGDLYNGPDVNYHYIRFTMGENRFNGEMVRLADRKQGDPIGTPSWEVKDHFQVIGK
jgi:hypothetical protein